ncbi:MAG: polysaccharide biosynthesis protein [Opitutus sp.]|nr:polysaccharide biosynthesis protein [Opitutus sp.]
MQTTVFDLSRNRRSLVLATVYTGILIAGFWLSYEVRFDFAVPPEFQTQRLQLLWVAVGVKLVALVCVRQIGSMLTYFSIPDLLRLIWAMTVGFAALFIIRITGLMNLTVPRGTLLLDYLLSIGGISAVRLGTRLYRERITRGRGAEHVPMQRIAIVGAGDAGASLAREFINAPARGFKPVIFFDDDKSKHGKLIHGVPVFGAPESIVAVRPNVKLSKVVIAMPSAPAKRVRDVVLLMNRQGYKVETLPSMEELASGRVQASRIRPVEVQDLLGRDPVNLDSASIRKLVEGKVVMVTGAGGSIGSELCRQIAQLNPSRLLMVEQSEASLFLIEQELKETGLGAAALPLVGDILDEARVEYLFSRYKPRIIFHAAAHKHVFMMERQPAEAFRNNVLGTRNVAQAAARHGAEEFVLISTDKAINPTSVMGATKRLAEMEIQALQLQSTTTKFMAVRFGNVLGSSGSVIPIFKRQIAQGGPVTVTHPEVTRYFMTIPEAVGLVLQSSVLGSGGEIFVLDMGQPVKIVDLAKQMIELSGYRVGEDIEITFTGLKPGEKLFEELQHRDEEHIPTSHSKIMRFVSQGEGHGVRAERLRELEMNLYRVPAIEVKAALKELVPEYTPHLD